MRIDELVFVASLELIDLSDPGLPRVRARQPLGRPTDHLLLVDDHLVLTGNRGSHGRVARIDVSGPNVPRIGGCGRGGCRGPCPSVAISSPWSGGRSACSIRTVRSPPGRWPRPPRRASPPRDLLPPACHRRRGDGGDGAGDPVAVGRPSSSRRPPGPVHFRTIDPSWIDGSEIEVEGDSVGAPFVWVLPRALGSGTVNLAVPQEAMT